MTAIIDFLNNILWNYVLVYGLLWYVMEETRGKPSLLPPSDDGAYRSRYRGNGGGDGSGGAYADRAYYDAGAPRGPMSSADLKARFSRLDQRLSSMEDCVTSNDYELRRELRKLEGQA